MEVQFQLARIFDPHLGCSRDNIKCFYLDEFDDPKVFDDTKAISYGSMDFDHPKVYSDISIFVCMVDVIRKIGSTSKERQFPQIGVN